MKKWWYAGVVIFYSGIVVLCRRRFFLWLLYPIHDKIEDRFQRALDSLKHCK
jgi:hypothetical protein